MAEVSKDLQVFWQQPKKKRSQQTHQSKISLKLAKLEHRILQLCILIECDRAKDKMLNTHWLPTFRNRLRLSPPVLLNKLLSQ